MGKTIFKRLAEVQIFHDYFLTMADGTSFFELNKGEKEKLLERKISRGLYSGSQIFEIAPQNNLKLCENKILFAQTVLGFILGVEVDEIVEAGEKKYKPVYDIPKNVTLSFLLKSKLPYFKSLTNIRLKPPYPAIYYFTNKDRQELVENSVPPHTSLPLSQNATTPQNGEVYEMGTLLDFGTSVKEAIQQTSGSDLANWENVEDRKFVTYADNMLLPHNFHYRFSLDQHATEVEAVLEDTGNNEIKKIAKTSTEPMASFFLNFTKIDENDDASDEIASGRYYLKLKINGAPELVHSIYLSEELYQRDYFGIVELRFDEENSPFSLLDAQGFLRTKIDAAMQKVPHPVFEIRFENRRSYWRYNKDNAFTANEINTTSSYLNKATANVLVAKEPKGLTASLVPFHNGSILLLPHPKTPNIRVEQDKIYSEIYINQSNGLLKN